MRGFLSLTAVGVLVIAAGCGEKKTSTAARQAPPPAPEVSSTENVADAGRGRGWRTTYREGGAA